MQHPMLDCIVQGKKKNNGHLPDMEQLCVEKWLTKPECIASLKTSHLYDNCLWDRY